MGDSVENLSQNRVSRGFAAWLLLTAVCLACTSHAQAQQQAERREGQVVAIAVIDGRAVFSVPTPKPSSKVLIVVSSLARSGVKFPVRLSARASHVPAPLEEPLAEPTRRVLALKPRAIDLHLTPSVPRPPADRVFHLLARPADPSIPRNYRAVRGRLRAIGNRIQVYVDENALTSVSDETLRLLVHTFDDQVWPRVGALLGTANDTDGDARLTVLFTTQLDELGKAGHGVDGLVRGADFDTRVAPPLGNGCDLICLNAGLRDGPYLQTILAHEYAHAVVFCRNVLQGDAGAAREEEGWLDEAIAHLVEDLHGFSRRNIDYRVNAYLCAPERYRVLVDDYFTADLFRSPGHRGAAYLFMRWCADRYGPGLLPALVDCPARGVASLEAVTGVTFQELYRYWSISLFLNGMAIDGRSAKMCPRPVVIEPVGRPECWSTEGTATHFVVIAGSRSPAVEIQIEAPEPAELQVTAVPLPDTLPRLELDAQTKRRPDGGLTLSLNVRERDGFSALIDSIEVMPLVPATGFNRGRQRATTLTNDVLASSLGGSRRVPAFGQVAAKSITLDDWRSGDGPLVVRLLARDQEGRPVAAWAQLEPDFGTASH